MAMPSDVGVIDLLIGFPSHDARHHYDYLRKLTKDTESQAADFPAEYMFKEVPNYLSEGADPIDTALQEMDFRGVAVGMLGNPESALCHGRYATTPDDSCGRTRLTRMTSRAQRARSAKPRSSTTSRP